MLKINTYSFSFMATCPADGDVIEYKARIQTDKMIRVEDINSYTSEIKEGFHEAIADVMAEKFGGVQEIIATHQGIQIITKRFDVQGLGASGVMSLDKSVDTIQH